MYKKNIFSGFLLMLAASLMSVTAAAQEVSLPNIIYILADDMGYGDPQCYNPASKIPTPHINRLASEGMRFTDAHSPSAVCTPTRYGILTGRYSWRSKLKNGVLWGYSQPLLEPGRPTVASFLKANGYHTAAIGKWHLGLGWQAKDGQTGPWIDGGNEAGYTSENIDFAKTLTGGPHTAGFDYAFGIPASLDMEPYVYVENNTITAVPDRFIEAGIREKEGFYRKGPIAPDFDIVQVLPTLTQKAVNYMEERTQNKQPFFLYFPLPSPHEPWVPAEEMKGKSRAGRYGDFVYQVDQTIGAILQKMDELHISENTLVIMASDNGAYEMFYPTMYNHDPNYTWRGQKADVWESGHRIPFIVRWPGKVKAGSVNNQTVCLTDLFATCAAVIGKALPENAAEDSFSLLPLLQGKQAKKPVREATIHHSSNGMFAIRQGDWKLILGEGGGGFGTTVKDAEFTGSGQLYNLKTDPAESTNLWVKHPEVVKRLSALLDTYQQTGRSRPK